MAVNKKDEIGVYTRKGSQSLKPKEYEEKANKLIRAYCDGVYSREQLDILMNKLKDNL